MSYIDALAHCFSLTYCHSRTICQPQHHPEFNLDENVLPRGVELFVNLALRALYDLKNEE